MSIVILRSKESIEAAIATMNPVAKEAAQLLAHRFLENPGIVEDHEAVNRELIQASAVSCTRAGMSQQSFDSFLENNWHAVLNVAVSIMVFVIEDAERRKKWGWLGQAAALVAGVAIGAFFG